MLRSDLLGCSDVYIVIKRKTCVAGKNAANRTNKKVTFKNNSPSRSCISKINNAFEEDLDIAMPM